RLPWLAVGPDPVVGECAFDLARLVRDRVEDLIAQPSGAATTRRRVKRLAESLEVDQERLRGWTLFRAVEAGVRARRVGGARGGAVLLEFGTGVCLLGLSGAVGARADAPPCRLWRQGGAGGPAGGPPELADRSPPPGAGRRRFTGRAGAPVAGVRPPRRDRPTGFPRRPAAACGGG